MTEHSSDQILRDFLSEAARKEKRNLLAASAIALAIGWADIVPRKIDALGVSFDSWDQQAFLILLIACVVYFAAAFIVYAGSDALVAMKHAFQMTIKEELEGYHDVLRGFTDLGMIDDPVDREVQKKREDLEARLWARARWTLRAVRARTIFDFLVPLGTAVVAIIVLVVRILNQPVFISGGGL